jgi:N-acetylglucosamine kinase-like BadF-type ATPase
MDLVLDLGQSGSRARINGVDYSFDISKNSSEAIVTTLRRIFEQLPRGEYERAYLSLTGLQGQVPETTPFGELCLEFFNSKQVAVMDDGLAAYCGAIGSQNGVVLTLGSGVVAIAGRSGTFAHSDGKGPIFGDFGGGYWIGRKGLSIAIATLDGRDNAEDLVELLSENLATYKMLEDKTSTAAASLCIATAKNVLQGAADGVISAQLIAQQAAQDLSKTVLSAWSKTIPKPEDAPTISFLGGLTQASSFIELIRNNISANIPKAQFVPPLGNHLDGAPAIAEQFPDGVAPLLDWWRA